MIDIKTATQRLQAHNQQHVLQFFGRLTPPQQTSLLEQVQSLDLDQLDDLAANYVIRKPQFSAPAKLLPPRIYPAKPADAKQADLYQQARKVGDGLIAAGKVAAFVVAGGQGTRLGFDGPKGCLEVTPIAHKPLFQVFAEQILAATRRCGVSIPWYIMTSVANDVATRAFFRRHEFFGLDPRNVFMLTQGSMPAFDFAGKLLMASPHELALSPDGHGGSLTALRRSGALDDMAKRGVEHISYFQVDNPLVRCLDPLFIGLHAMQKADMSAKSMPKRDPLERVGNFCIADGKVTVIEYSDMPEELARATAEDGRLRFGAGSIAIHVLSRAFVEKLVPQGGRAMLPFHRADKKVPCIDAEGNLVKPLKPNAVKLEMFVFDALPLAENVVILETTRDDEFSPVKNASGEDSLVTCLHDQVRRSANWLAAAGIAVPRDADGQVAATLEISPLYADSEQELAAKADRAMRIVPGQSVYLS